MNIKSLTAACLLFATPCVAKSLIPKPPIAGQAWVVDDAHLLDEQSLLMLNQTLRNFESKHKSVITVLTVRDLGGADIESFGIQVAEAWKIGNQKRDDGLIMIIAEKERRLRLEVGYGLEGVVTDAMSKRILNEMVKPAIQSSGFAKGIDVGIHALMELIASRSLTSAENSTKETQSDSATDDTTENRLKLPSQMHLYVLILSIPLILLFGLAGLFQSQIVYFLVGVLICSAGGFVVVLLTNEEYGAISGGTSFFIYILIRQFIKRSKWGQRVLAASGSDDASSSDIQSSSGTESSTVTSSENSSDSSRGGSFGGGGASDSF